MGVTRVVCGGPYFPLLRNGPKKNESEVSRERSDIVYIDKRKKRENKEGEKEDEVPLSLVQMQVNTVN